MHSLFVITSFLPLLARSLKVIVLSNDDGWAEKNIRTFRDNLDNAGHAVLLSAPAYDQSGPPGIGSMDAAPTDTDEPCQFDSCPAGSPFIDFSNDTDQLYYVNSYPATAMQYGLDRAAEVYPDNEIDIAVAGPNVGPTLGNNSVLSSGTVGAVTRAVQEGVAAIAFSGATGNPVSWTSDDSTYSSVYGALALYVTQMIITDPANPSPYLPDNTWLNVNFPNVDDRTCNRSAGGFKFVLSRIEMVEEEESDDTPADVETCGSRRLPTEEDVIYHVNSKEGCYVSISVARADTKLDASANEQGAVYEHLKDALSCLPKSDPNGGHKIQVPFVVCLLLVGLHWLWASYL